MRCLILGGGGFIGSHLADALLRFGYDVAIFDRPRARYLEQLKQKGASIFTGDFTNPEDVRPALENCDVLYHLISTTLPQTSNDDLVYDVQTNVIGTVRLLEEARKAQIVKVVFASSGGTVYGVPHEIPIKESHPTEPTSSYGICKLAIEKYLQLYERLHGLGYLVLRIANAYGPRQPITATQGVIPAFFDRAFRQEELIVWGDGSVMRDYVYISDIVDALEKAATYAGKHNIFNIGAGQGHSINDIFESISNVMQTPLQIRYMPSRVFDVPVNVLDVSRAQSFLNWEPRVSLQEGISLTCDWARRNYKNEDF